MGVDTLSFKTLEDDWERESVGGKAFHLQKVRQLGLNVPECFLIETEVLGTVLGLSDMGCQVEDYLKASRTASAEALVHQFERLKGGIEELPQRVDEMIRALGLRAFESAPYGLAVRSSAIYEDSEKASFAGVFESWLGVADLETLGRRVRDCWLASWAPRAIRYLHRMGIEPVTAGMAVLVQPVLQAKASGVLYTANPDSGNPFEYVISATPGLSNDLLSGEGRGDEIRLDVRSGQVVAYEQARIKDFQDATPEGLRRTELSERDRVERALTQAELHEIWALGTRLDEGFASRLDIEFVVGRDGVQIVQARPLTALPEFFPCEICAEDSDRSWDRLDFILPLRGDVPPGFITPFYAHLSDAELWQRYQPSDITLGVYCLETRDFCGYRYSASGKLPIFTDYFDKIADCEGWLEHHEPRDRDRWSRHQDELKELALVAKGAMEKSGTAREFVPDVFRVGDWLWDLNAFGWSGPQYLGWMCQMLLGDFLKAVDPEIETESLGGGELSYTYEVTRDLQALGRSIDEDEVRRAFQNESLDHLFDVLCGRQAGSKFMEGLEHSCWVLGKCPPRWRGRPSFWSHGIEETNLMHTIRAAVLGQSKDVEALRLASLESRGFVERRVRERLASSDSGLMPRFDRMLEWFRYWSQALNDRHRLSIGLLWEREMVWELGRRFCREGALAVVEDVLLLTRQDLQEYVEDGSVDKLTARVSEQQRIVQNTLRLIAPKSLGGCESNTTASVVDASEPTLTASANRELVGQGIGSVTVTGKARLAKRLDDPRWLDLLTASDILVLPGDRDFHYADWHSLLTLIGGVVSAGRLSHHLAQVARECRVPIVGNVGRIPSDLHEGSTLEVNPRTGVVRRLA